MVNKPHKVRKGIELSSNDLDWFYKEFGDDASLSWYLGLLIGAAREIHETSISSPKEIAHMSAKEIKEIEHEL